MTERQSSSPMAGAPSVSKLKLGAALSLAAFMAACATSPQPGPSTHVPPPPPPPTGPQVVTQQGVTPPFMSGRPIVRIGLLLPFSSSPQAASALYNAAELALFDHGDQNTLLIPRDAGGDEAAASAAARALASDGADVIIGPVIRDGVQGAGEAVRGRNIPVIGFSSDRTVAGNGVYLLSFQLEDEIGRLVSYAAAHNIRTIALLAPANEYGQRVQQALQQQAQANGITIVAAQLYNRNDQEAAAAAGTLATQLRTTPAQAILIADNGTPLRAIGTSLVRNGIDQHQVRFLGTSAWAGDAQREPTMAGGWYVSSDPSARTGFENSYTQMFGASPTRLSSLAYDAVSLAAYLTRNGQPDAVNRGSIENPEGFGGADGLFRFSADGSIQRGLAVIEVKANDINVIDPAPQRFPAARG
ncbi:MAG: penicillin-binding protein activator [Terricaulis sp.]